MKTLKFPPDRKQVPKLKIYLCIPYTGVEHLSFRMANRISAKLMEEGHVVFSPISHNHKIGEYISKKNDTLEFWMGVDLPFLEWCDEVYVVVFNGSDHGYELIDKSRGCQAEIARARELNKPIKPYPYREPESVSGY